MIGVQTCALPIYNDTQMKATEDYEKSQLYKIRHTAAHLLAMAAIKWDPDVKLAIGPPIENGFYYDFEFSKPFTDDVLAELEQTMRQLAKKDLPVEHKLVVKAEAIKTATAEIGRAHV